MTLPFTFFWNTSIKGMTIFPFILLSKTASEKTLNHERIHLKQELQLLPFSIVLNSLVILLLTDNLWWLLLNLLPFLNSSVFYIWYIIDYLRRGYRGIIFEREAYINDDNFNYLKETKGKWFTFLKYK